MSNEDYLLTFSLMTVDDCCDQLGKSLGRVRAGLVGLEVAQSASRQVDGETWCCVDQAVQQRRKLRDRAPEAMDKDQ